MSETDWEKRYIEKDTPWDKGEPAPGLVDWLKNQNLDPDARILVPGCGCGHDARAWAEAGFETTGIDLSELALTQARQKYQSIPGLAFFREFLEDEPQEPYDLIFEHTLYCAIDPARRDEYVLRLTVGSSQAGISLLSTLLFTHGRGSTIRCKPGGDYRPVFGQFRTCRRMGAPKL